MSAPHSRAARGADAPGSSHAPWSLHAKMTAVRARREGAREKAARRKTSRALRTGGGSPPLQPAVGTLPSKNRFPVGHKGARATGRAAAGEGGRHVRRRNSGKPAKGCEREKGGEAGSDGPIRRRRERGRKRARAREMKMERKREIGF